MVKNAVLIVADHYSYIHLQCSIKYAINQLENDVQKVLQWIKTVDNFCSNNIAVKEFQGCAADEYSVVGCINHSTQILYYLDVNQGYYTKVLKADWHQYDINSNTFLIRKLCQVSPDYLLTHSKNILPLNSKIKYKENNLVNCIKLLNTALAEIVMLGVDLGTFEVIKQYFTVTIFTLIKLVRSQNNSKPTIIN